MVEADGLLVGPAALDWLAAHLDETDVAASSHWRQEHETFIFENGQFSGLRGFGHHAAPARGLRRWVHTALQRRYRNMAGDLPQFRELDALTADITARQNRLYELDALRQALSLAQILALTPDCLAEDALAVVIGDGFGTMSALILAAAPSARVATVNLNKTLLVDLTYAAMTLPPGAYALALDREAVNAGLANADIRLLGIRATDANLVAALPVSLAVNIASMQEMRLADVGAYFDALRSAGGAPTLFYCCNREKKTLPDGEVIQFADYPWRDDDDVLLDGICPWHQFFYSPIPPFYRPYAGVVRHRLARLAPDDGCDPRPHAWQSDDQR